MRRLPRPPILLLVAALVSAFPLARAAGQAADEKPAPPANLVAQDRLFGSRAEPSAALTERVGYGDYEHEDNACEEEGSPAKSKGYLGGRGGSFLFPERSLSRRCGSRARGGRGGRGGRRRGGCSALVGLSIRRLEHLE